MQPNYTFVANLADSIGDLPSDSIISRTLYRDDRVRAVLFGFAAGQELSEHTSSQAAILHFVKGEARLTLGEDVLDAVAGTWVRMPLRLAHSIFAKTPTIMLLLLLKSDDD